MKIQEVTIEGYQSHTNSTFRLSPGLTVITGPSDAGKTAIIRALRWQGFLNLWWYLCLFPRCRKSAVCIGRLTLSTGLRDRDTVIKCYGYLNLVYSFFNGPVRVTDCV